VFDPVRTEGKNVLLDNASDPREARPCPPSIASCSGFSIATSRDIAGALLPPAVGVAAATAPQRVPTAEQKQLGNGFHFFPSPQRAWGSKIKWAYFRPTGSGACRED
jgi:hypothetical protein